MKKLKTEWEVKFYEVWGNSKDGYDINDISGRDTVKFNLKIEDKYEFEYY
jgi:hypothetical protein